MIAKGFAFAGLCFAVCACGAPRAFVSPNAAMERNVALGLLLEYDSNQDRSLTSPEFETALRADFVALDGNGDGGLDNVEVSAENDRRWRLSGSASTPLIDWNTDGIVDFAEFTSTLRSTFTQLDEDEDGTLSAEELAIAEYRQPQAAFPENRGAPPNGARPNGAPDGYPVGG